MVQVAVAFQAPNGRGKIKAAVLALCALLNHTKPPKCRLAYLARHSQRPLQVLIGATVSLVPSEAPT